MILTRLSASNFQRYRELSIRSLPSRGVIGVVGENESGKSTIGEAITLGLFGRTVRLPAERLKESIHWQADSASVSVRFTAGEREYEVLREFDRDDTNFAQLSDAATGEVLARGVGKVQRAMLGALRFGFEDFRHSFHLGQKEFDVLAAPDAGQRQRIIDGLVGIDRIDAAARALDVEIEAQRTEQQSIEREVAVTERLTGEFAGAAVEPKEARLRESEGRVAELSRSLTDARTEGSLTESQAGHHRHAVAALEAIKLRAELAQLKHALECARQGAALVGERAVAAEGEARELAARLEAHRDFSAKLDELEGLARLRADELGRELKNNLDGVYSEADGDLITPDGKREQLVFTEKRIAETEARIGRKRARAAFFQWMGILLLAAGCGVLLALPVRVLPVQYASVGAPVLVAAMALLASRKARREQKELDRKRGRLDMNRSILQEEVGHIRRSLEACMAISRQDPSTWSERVRQIESPRIQELFDRLIARHSGLMHAEYTRPGFGEGLEESLRDKQREVAGLGRQAQELESFAAWLSTTVATLAASPHVPRTMAGPGARPWTAEQMRAEKPALLALAPEASRRVYSVEAVLEPGDDPVEVLRRALDALLGGGDPGAAPDRTFYEEVATLGSGRGAGTAAQLAERLRVLDRQLVGWLPALQELDARSRSVSQRRDDLQRELESARLARETARIELERLEPDVKRGQRLSERLAELKRQLAAVTRSLAVRTQLSELFGELRAGLRRRCGPAIGEFMAWVLPQLTGGRYGAVRISPELAVEVYAPEKGDYVALDRLSGGTVDQLLLTLRLAFSKALIYTKQSPEYEQYLFLDEPFSSFDESRAASFLTFLRKPDRNFAQVFLVSHLPGLVDSCDLLIRTELSRDELVVN